MNSATEKAQAALDHFGYLVMRWIPGPKPAPKPGDVIPHPIRSQNGEQVAGPFIVTAETTREDIRAQHVFTGVAEIPSIEGERYFRLVAE